jgi:leader peptidase (prepilin peptidase)/N-methyltransferase
MLPSQAVDAALAGVLGLLVGSFLNVVIYRTPMMMYRQWLGEAVGNLMKVDGVPSLWSLVFGPKTNTPPQLERAAGEAAKAVDALPPFSLARPASRCGHCGHAIRWYENVPVLSYLFLRGRCSACKASISPRYPLVEGVMGALFALCAWRYGLSPTAALWAAFAALLVCQFLIDLDTQYLPDSLNYALLWLGLIGAAAGLTRVPLASAVWGAVFGYLSLWLVYHAFRLATGKEGMGHGDFKLLAALGAWFGWQALPMIVLLSSLAGAVVGVGLILLRGHDRNVPIPFGPYLALAGWIVLVAGRDLTDAWLRLTLPS